MIFLFLKSLFMAKSLHTTQERLHLCAEARRLLKSETRFADISDRLGVNPNTLRKWLNDQTKDAIFPRVPNVGRL